MFILSGGGSLQLSSSPFLDFTSKKLGLEKVKALLTKLRRHKSIKILILSDNDLDDSVVSALVDFINDPNVPLEKLDLSMNNITETGASALREAARKKESLSELNLRGNGEGSDKVIKEIESMMEARSKHPAPKAPGL